MILSYLRPRGLNQNYSTFLFKLNSALYNELEEQNIDTTKINTMVSLLRKFSTNVFKSENEELIRQVIYNHQDSRSELGEDAGQSA